MMEKNQRFVEVEDPKILGRISRSQDVKTIRQYTGFIAINLKNGNKYQVIQEGNTLICTCPDAQKGHAFPCKHEIAAARDIRLYEEV